MTIVEGLSQLPKPLPGSVVTIGNYDGVHLGHRALIARVISRARALRVPAVVFTFEPHPVQVLFPERKLKRLFPREDQCEILKQLGVDWLVIEPFSRHLSQTSPADFLQKCIFEPLNPVALVVGYDFSFGANRQGGTIQLEEISKKRGVELEVFPAYQAEGSAVSSTRIRNSIIQGDLEGARRLLGRPFYLQGIVEKGNQRGRTIGFPTANLTILSECLPAIGVYATWTWVRGKKMMSATNVGVNPTFQENGAVSVESHILDFDDFIYGEEIRVEFIQRLRSEKKFSSVDELKTQLHSDVQSAQKILNEDS